MSDSPRIRRVRRGFTLTELLVSIAILLVVMVVLLQITGAVGDIWKSSTGKISALQSARTAFATLTRTLARATLNTYNDYVDATGNPRTAANAQTFSPARFERASELHFLSGPAIDLINTAVADRNPGHAVIFQAPLGGTDDAAYDSLDRTVNSIGFFIQYELSNDSVLPTWLKSLPFVQRGYRFQLVQIIEPTEKLSVYTSTKDKTYDTNWTANFIPNATAPRARVLAEDICLLALRPRLSPKDEESAATALGLSYDAADDPSDGSSDVGALICPTYEYDSREWEQASTTLSKLKRNQIPPIIDVAMVSVDRRALAKLDMTTATPPAVFAVPSGAFTDAKSFEKDLKDYTDNLFQNGITCRVFRTSVQLESARWSSSN
jgi:uncharacterized protein (TIGR02599 family)